MWEYQTVTAPKSSFKKLDEQLNALGREGWEAVGTVTAKKGNTGVLLKRAATTRRRSTTSRPRKQPSARKATKRTSSTSRPPRKRATVRKATRKATKRPSRRTR
jgi:hypothetical protein